MEHRYSYAEVRELVQSIKRPEVRSSNLDIVGASTGMRNCLFELGIFAESVNAWDEVNYYTTKPFKGYKPHEPLLILGERGTGKDILVDELRAQLRMRSQPFVKWTASNASAADPNIVRSDLHGHIKNSFTGAATTVMGKLRGANGGVFFLDELHVLPNFEQTRMNNVAEYGIVEPIGSEPVLGLNTLMVAATNVDLEILLNDGSLNADLYDRFSTFKIHLPRLNERREDIPGLIDYFARSTSQVRGWDATIANFTLDAVTILVNSDWPGNIRSLRNIVTALVARYLQSGTDRLVEAENVRDALARTPQQTQVLHHPILREASMDRPSNEELKKMFNERCLRDGSTRADLARDLGVRPDTLRNWLRVAGVEAGRAGAPGRPRPGRNPR